MVQGVIRQALIELMHRLGRSEADIAGLDLESACDVSAYTADGYLTILLAAMQAVQDLGAWAEYEDALAALGAAPPTPQTVRTNITKFLKQHDILQSSFLLFLGVDRDAFARFMKERKAPVYVHSAYHDGARFFFFKRILEQTRALKACRRKILVQEKPLKTSGQKRPFEDSPVSSGDESSPVSSGDECDKPAMKYRCTAAQPLSLQYMAMS